MLARKLQNMDFPHSGCIEEVFFGTDLCVVSSCMVSLFL